MSAETQDATQVHGGRLVAQRLKAHGVRKLFTLSGGHLFSIFDGCRQEGIDIVDVRHESAATFAAEGWAKVTREPGVAALTAGPGVTNGMSAIASAQQNGSPIVVLGEVPESDEQAALPDAAGGPVPDVARAAALLREAERPVIMAGTNLYWGPGEGAP